MSDKISYEDIKFFYETAYQSAMNSLFRNHFEKHGWRYDDFMEEYSKEEELIDFVIDPNATIH
jgi:hypothetical protein